MQGYKAYSDIYSGSVAVQKIKAGARKVIVTDKNDTIQRFAQPVAEPSQSEISAGREFRRIIAKYPFVESSAQTVELTIDSNAHTRSVACGLNRPPPKIFLPDGTRTSKPEEVHGWGYLLNPDAFIGFGSGIYLLNDDVYLHDKEYEVALGGPAWRPRVEEGLLRIYPDGRFKKNLGLVDRDGLFEMGGVDVARLAFRVEFKHYHEEGYREREELCLSIIKAQLRGDFPSDVVIIDESNPPSYTTYLVPTYGPKDMALERFGNQLSFHSGVPMEELEWIKIGDSPTDLASGLKAFQGASNVKFILAADSRLSESLHNNESEFAGMPLIGSPNHPALPGRYYPTDTPGVYWWRGQHVQPRQVILAHYAPWSRGMKCTESVLACMHYLGFKALASV